MLPLRGATHQPGVLDLRGGISIHTPLAGNDWTGQDGTRERG